MTPTHLLWLLAVRAFGPDALQVILDGRPSEVSTTLTVQSGRNVFASGLATACDALIILLAGAALLGVVTRPRQARYGRLLWAGAALFSFGILSVVGHGHRPRMSTVAVVAGVIALSLRPPTRVIAAGIAARLALLVAFASLVLAVVSPGTATFVSNDGRLYLVTAERLAGVMMHPNALGYVMAFALPCLLATSTGARRLLGATLLAITLVGTASRTALAVAAVAVLLSLTSGTRLSLPIAKAGQAERLDGQGRERFRHRRAGEIAVLGVIGAAVVSLRPLFGGEPPLLSSQGRSQLWSYVLATWRDHQVWGHGVDAWATLAADTSGFLQFAFHAHNLWLDALYTTGAVGLIAIGSFFLVWFVTAAKQRHETVLPLILLLVVTLEATTEVPIYYLSWESRTLLIVLALACSAKGTGTNRQQDGEETSGTATVDLANRPGARHRPATVTDDRRRVTSIQFETSRRAAR